MTMGKDSDILVGLYLGTSKISVVVAERAAISPDEAQIIGIGEAPSRGLRKGMIVNLEQAVSSVSDAVADAESLLSGIKISRALVAFSGVDVRSGILHGMVSLGRSPRQIMPEDLERVVETALSELTLPPGSCVIHSVPIKYAIDGNKGIDDPLGMTGIRLEVELMAAVVPLSVAQNVVNCVEKAGVSVTGLVLKPITAALGALSPDERDMGASVVSIGGGSTSVAIFSEGRLIKIAEIPVGGDHVTNDLSCVLKIPFSAAENIKKQIDITPEAEHEGTVTVENRGRTQELENAEVAEIIENRLDELFGDHVAPNLASVLNSGVPADVVLSGGVVLTKSMEAFAASHLNTSVRIGAPILKKQMQPGRDDCRYIGVAGIIVYLMEKRRRPFAYMDAPLATFKSPLSASGASGPKKERAGRASFAAVIRKWARSVKELIKELF